MRDRILGELIGLARATDGNEHLISPGSTKVIVEALRNLNTPEKDILLRIEDEKRNMVPDCFTCANPCGKNAAYDMAGFHSATPEIQTAKGRLLSGIQLLASKGNMTPSVVRFLYKALIIIGIEEFTPEDLDPFLKELDSLIG